MLIETALGGTGDQQIDLGGPSTLLGPNAETTDYQLAIGWNTTTDTLTTELFLADGTSVVSHFMVVTVPTALVTDYLLTHVGWSDYTGDVNQVTNVDWDVDSVAFYLGDAGAAFNDANPAPTTVPADRDFDGDVDGVDFAKFASCFNKAGNPPRTIGCPVDDAGAFDFDGDMDVDGVDFGKFAACFNKAGNPPRTLGCPQN